MKKRLDQLLVEKSFFPTRSRAQSAILAGLVYVNSQKEDKAGTLVAEDAGIEVKGKPHPYVGRGGVKLEHALKEFGVKVLGRTAIDIGASTGGFTDCLLKNGAEKIYAVDVGYGQLDWGLRNDPRVKVFERLNARHLTLKEMGMARSDITLAVIDVSFISLSNIFPAVYNLLAEEAEVLALIKPQFEAGKGEVGKGGIVRDEGIRQAVIGKVKAAAMELGFKVEGTTASPISGADGNIEYFIHLRKTNKK